MLGYTNDHKFAIVTFDPKWLDEHGFLTRVPTLVTDPDFALDPNTVYQGTYVVKYRDGDKLCYFQFGGGKVRQEIDDRHYITISSDYLTLHQGKHTQSESQAKHVMSMRRVLVEDETLPMGWRLEWQKISETRRITMQQAGLPATVESLAYSLSTSAKIAFDLASNWSEDPVDMETSALCPRLPLLPRHMQSAVHAWSRSLPSPEMLALAKEARELRREINDALWTGQGRHTDEPEGFRPGDDSRTIMEHVRATYSLPTPKRNSFQANFKCPTTEEATGYEMRISDLFERARKVFSASREAYEEAYPVS